MAAPKPSVIDVVMEGITIFNEAAPRIAQLINIIRSSPSDKPIGEIIAEADAQWDANIKQAEEGLKI
jgi:hypothetical protein